MKVVSLLLLAVALLAQSTPQFNDELTQGKAAFKASRYAEASAHFQRATELDPSNLEAQLSLATAYMIRWVPGVDSSENQRNHDLAVTQFRGALDKDPKNSIALASLASIAYNSSVYASPEQRSNALDEAISWNQRRIDANPNEPEAYYYLGVIAWMKAFPPIQQARIEAKMKPSDPGPLTDLNARIDLQTRYSETIASGIANLRKCLELDGQNGDAMSYLNLLLRKKADLEDSTEVAEADTVEANDWSQKSLDIKKAKASRPRQTDGSSVSPDLLSPGTTPLVLVPPPPPSTSIHSDRVRIGGQVAEANLIRKVPPVYPSLAQSAGVQGSVEFTVVISPEGDVESMQLVRGHRCW